MDNFQCDIELLDIVLWDKILEPELRRNERAVANGIDKTMKEMVAETKENAPVDDNNWGRGSEYEEKGNMPFMSKGRNGKFRDAITWEGEDRKNGHRATWYVKSPEYRLAHLLAHGHELFVYGKPMNKRTDGNPFIHNARDKAEANVIDNIIEEEEKLR